jgi:hydrogenase-4 component F
VIGLIAFVGLSAALYSWGYVRREPRAVRLYYSNLNFFVFSLLAVPALTHPVLVWIAVELTALSSILLVSFDNTHEALEAAWKYAALMIMAGMTALLGFLTLYWAFRNIGGPFTWDAVTAAAPHMAPGPLRLAFVLILVGFGTKVGLVPLHTWLPDAHSQAPSPVCAVLSGVKTVAALYAILRLVPIVLPTTGLYADHLMLVAGLLSVAVAAVLLAQVRDYKRLFAYSTVEHMGIILAAAGLGGPMGHFGAAYQIITHGVTKSFCFLAAGAVLWATDTRDIAGVRRLVRRSPVAAAALIVGALAIAGAPPFPVFLSELTILRAGVAGGHLVAVCILAFFIGVAFLGIMVRASRMVLAPSPGTGGHGENDPLPKPPPADSAHTHHGRLPAMSVFALSLALVPVLVLGVYTPATLHTLMRLAAAALRG